jgi:hypothetical protein
MLVVLLMAGVAQGLSAQFTQYKYLNRLHEDSQLRRKCESVKSSWFGKRATEKACDNLDNHFETLRQQFKSALWFGTDINDCLAQIKKENTDALKILDVDNDDERSHMGVLMGQIINKEIMDRFAAEKAAKKALESGAAFR